MKWTGRLLLVVTVFLLTSFQLHAGEKVILTSLDWEPYIGQKLQNNGYVAEIATEAFKLAGYEVEIKFYPWARTKKMAVDGKVDGYFPEYYADELKSHSLISDPFPGGPVGFFKLKGRDIGYSTLEDLKPYTIGVVRGYVNEAKFDAATFLKKDEANDDITNIKKLLKKRVDLIVADKFVGFYLLKENLPDDVGKLEFVSPVLEDKDLYVCISKKTSNAPQKLKAFNDGLAMLKNQGKIGEILKRHGF